MLPTHTNSTLVFSSGALTERQNYCRVVRRAPKSPTRHRLREQQYVLSAGSTLTVTLSKWDGSTESARQIAVYFHHLYSTVLWAPSRVTLEVNADCNAPLLPAKQKWWAQQHGELRCLMKSPWQIQGGRAQRRFRSLLWAGTNSVAAQFCCWMLRARDCMQSCQRNATATDSGSSDRRRDGAKYALESASRCILI